MNALGPHDGERVLFCEHADVGEDHINLSVNTPYHWYYLGDRPTIERDDGMRLVCKWLAICNFCQEHANPKDSKYSLGRDAPWIGEPPNIYRDIE